MPTPLELLLDPLTLSVIAIFAGLALWEAMFPARPLPRVRAWRTRGLLAFTGYMAISSYLPFLWAEWLAPLQLFDLSSLGTLAGAAIGVLVYEAGVWIWHRGLHGSNTLWRYLHQWHHSAERLDTWGAFWFSPLDMVGWTALFSLALTLVGLSPSAIFATVCTTTFLSVFQHANVRTPRWLGVFVQRPESHSWHHAPGRTRVSSRRSRAFITAPRPNTRACCLAATWPRAPMPARARRPASTLLEKSRE
jgi:sterol desaturase/sphingolipid hydroxylase (fatty acid hydroxylase superfamily)